MIVDPSAVLAVLLGEPEREAFVGVLSTAGLDEALDQLGVELVPVTPAQTRIARQAYRDFGRGRGHPARLNVGDCLSYALAVESARPCCARGTTSVTPTCAPWPSEAAPTAGSQRGDVGAGDAAVHQEG